VHGAARDLLDYVEYTVTTELNAATDHPRGLVDDGMPVSAGRFHGPPPAFALDAPARTAVSHGRPVPAPPDAVGDMALLHEGELVAVGRAADGQVRPAVVLATP
jgi:hypothetical protein